MSSIARPATEFDGATHSYYLDGEKLPGVSTVAKIGDDEAWGIASAWGFRIGYEGTMDLLTQRGALREFQAYVWRDQKPTLITIVTPDDLREALKFGKLTPWATRDKAGERGTWVHDVLEGLGQTGEVNLDGITPETEGHVKGVCEWFIDYRPEFEALEVQVTSKRHGFSGRYDVRARIKASKLVDLFEDHSTPQAERVREEAAGLGGDALCLIDLKTSKRCYPTSHFPQLSGYELASVEMGFGATDAQFVLNTHPDGTYDFIPSWSQGEDFLAYLGAHNAIRRIKAADPAERKREREEADVVAHLPAKFGELLDWLHMERGPLMGMLKKLKKDGRIEQVKGQWRAAATPEPTVGNSQQMEIE
jgi:hypothetical protein